MRCAVPQPSMSHPTMSHPTMSHPSMGTSAHRVPRTRPVPRSETARPLLRNEARFTVRLDLAAGSAALAGVLDRRTVHLFHDAVRTLQAADRPEWVIDVSALVDCDVIGLRALGDAYRRALVRGRRVVVHEAPPWLCEALARIRLDSHVLVAPRES